MNRKTLFLLPALLFLGGCSGTRSAGSQYYFVSVVILVIVVLFVALAVYTNLLRDEVGNCGEFEANAQKAQVRRGFRARKENPFSLTKVQFGLWTVVISSSYIYLALCKGDCSETTLNKTALVLLGIFSGTAAASTIIDKREIGDGRPRHQNAPSEGFFIDILSDDNGISLHRFQTLVWTLIAITVYFYKLSQVKNGCQLPELSDTLLALTGISSATFVALRAKENDPPVADTGNGQPPAPPPQPPANPYGPPSTGRIPEFYG